MNTSHISVTYRGLTTIQDVSTMSMHAQTSL